MVCHRRSVSPTGYRHAIYRCIETWVPLGDAAIDSGATTAIVHQDRSGPGEYIVRVLRDPLRLPFRRSMVI